MAVRWLQPLGTAHTSSLASSLYLQVERAAAGGKRGVEAEDIRQPHNALAVRLRQRDPGFSTGEPKLQAGWMHAKQCAKSFSCCS